MGCLLAGLAVIVGVLALSVILALNKRKRERAGAPTPAPQASPPPAAFVIPKPDPGWATLELKKIGVRLRAPASARVEEIAWEGIEPEISVTLPNGYDYRVKACADFAAEVAKERSWVSDPSHRRGFLALLETPDAFVHTAIEAPYGQYWAAMAASAPVQGVVFYAHTHGTIVGRDQKPNLDISADECAQLVAIVRSIAPI